LVTSVLGCARGGTQIAVLCGKVYVYAALGAAPRICGELPSCEERDESGIQDDQDVAAGRCRYNECSIRVATPAKKDS
jgi:hypothetical protein